MTLLATVLLVGWVTALLIAERIVPARAPTGGWPRIGRNVALGVLALAVAPFILAGVGRLSPSSGLVPLPAGVAGLAIKFVALDVWTYALHRAYHRVPAMWRLHAPHHLDEHLDTTSAFRFHVGEIVLSGTLRVIPALVLGIGPAEMLAFETLLAAGAAFHHSNLALPRVLERWLGVLVVTPTMHRLHHHPLRADTDSNYTALLSVWDRVFASRNGRAWRRDMAIGVDGERDRPLRELLAWPLVAEHRRNLAVAP